MATIYVKLMGVGSKWGKPSKQAVRKLNSIFKSNGLNITLSTKNLKGITILVRLDPSIGNNAVHGKTRSEFSGSGAMLRATVGLPKDILINTPQGIRSAGAGVFEVIVAHELVHALGHDGHNSHLMARTMQKEMGDSAAQDTLKAGGVLMPPLKLSPKSIKNLKAIWN